MNRIVGLMRCCDEVFWVEYPPFAMNDVIGNDRIHVVHKKLTVNFVFWDS